MKMLLECIKGFGLLCLCSGLFIALGCYVLQFSVPTEVWVMIGFGVLTGVAVLSRKLLKSVKILKVDF